MENMQLYNAVRECPANALKQISAGRLKGKSDINPMWRIQELTNQFGACGVGWYYEITKQWLEQGADGEISAFCNIDLFIKTDGEWSKPIQGTGGSSYVSNERNGKYTSDECFKMALTDAISVACKALGFAADVYWNEGRTKYSGRQTPEPELTCPQCGRKVKGLKSGDKVLTPGQVFEQCGRRCYECYKKEMIKNGQHTANG